ncbi:LacI family DNA-binding transcriptional regulator [Winogradskyella sp.]|uniref:LacI family DNA-binding transcriptional regulator n=1 Tax=Winogradskyella sp. TaxID=1883156 RepID=UPI003BAC15E5
MNKKTTIQDIARELKVTPSTVSRALNDHPRISRDTKEAVQRVATKLNYSPNYVASALRKGTTQLLGLVVPRINRAFFSSVVRGVEEIALNKGYSVIVAQSNEDLNRERDVIKAFLNARVAGIFSSLGKNTTQFDHYLEAQKRGVPIVLFDRTTTAIDASKAVIDDYMGGYMATEHLINQGCQRIVHFTSHQASNIYKERLRGYLDALKDHNIDLDEGLVIPCDLQLEDGIDAVNNVLSKKKYDGIFSTSDYTALGAIKALKAKGKSIPEEVCVIGFSNEPFTEFVEPPLSTVDQFPEDMGKAAAELFFKQIESDSDLSTTYKTMLQPQLIIRKSSNRLDLK